MKKDPHQHLIDTCLEEILGGRRPPDLKQRILSALKEQADGERTVETNDTLEWTDPQKPAHEVAASQAASVSADLIGERNGMPIVETQTVPLATSRRNRTRTTTQTRFAIGAGLLAIGASVALACFFVFQSDFRWGDRRQAADDSLPGSSEKRIDGVGGGSDFASNDAVTGNRDGGSAFDNVVPFGNEQIQTPQFGKRDNVGLARTRSSDSAVIAFIDDAIRQAWGEVELGLVPADPVDSSQWCQRVYLKILGRAPTNRELSRFVNDGSADKRERLVDLLLHDRQYHQELTNHWTDYWMGVLLGGAPRYRRLLPSASGFESFVHQAVHEQKPLDQIAFELISASGSPLPGNRNFNGAANWLISLHDEKALHSTGEVARVFLGRRVQCAQCHDHPIDLAFRRREFWEMNAFLRQMSVTKEHRSVRPLLVNRDYEGEDGDANNAAIFFEGRDGLMQAAFPEFEGQSLPRSGRIAEVDRRTAWARMIVKSDSFGQSAVNRLWSHFFGYGFTKPVDDMGPHNPASHPELLARLADEFAAHQYDVKKLVKWVVLSEAFSLGSSNHSDWLVDAPQLGTVPRFSRFYRHSEQIGSVEGGLATFVDAYRDLGGSLEARRSMLARVMPGGGMSDLVAQPIDSSMLLESMQSTPWSIQAGYATQLQRIADSDQLTFEEKVDHLFLTALGRLPSRRERRLAVEMSQTGETVDLQSVLQDVWWAILSSQESRSHH